VHYVKKDKLEQHYEECAYKQTHIASRAIWDAVPSTYCQPKLIVDKGIQESTETWEDLSGPSFIPENLQAEASYMITPAGMSKSKRKQFKETERQRLRDKESSSDSSQRKSDSAKQMKFHHEYDSEPRKPDTAPKMAGPKIAARFSTPGDVNETYNYPRRTSSTSFHSTTLSSLVENGFERQRWSNAADSAPSQRYYTPEEYPDLF